MNGAKRYLIGIAAAGILGLGACDRHSNGSTQPAAREDDVAVYFSPETNCEDKVVKLIKQSTKSVWVQAYSFHSDSIAKALLAARKRGVDVKVIIDADKADDKSSEAKWLAKRGMPTYLDDKHKAHNKIILIDGETIITGSYNFTPAEESRDANNLLVIVDHPKLMAAYARNFTEHLDHSDLKD